MEGTLRPKASRFFLARGCMGQTISSPVFLPTLSMLTRMLASLSRESTFSCRCRVVSM